MLINDVFMENSFVNFAIIDLSNGQIVIFTSLRTIQYNTMLLYKSPLSVFVNKAMGL